MEDSGIIEMIWNRNEGGLRAADEKHGSFCRAMARHLLGSSEDAEECWSDTLLRLWNSVPPERPNNLRAYLAKLTRSVSIDRLRATTAEKRGGGETPLLLDELAECVSGAEDVESETLFEEMGKAISAFLANQPTRRRQMFVLRYFHGEPVSALAKRYGMKANSVSVSLRCTRAALRRYLEKEGFSV